MNYLIKVCQRYGILDSDMDYHVLRASMVLIFLFFGYQKWFEYEAQALIPYISNGPLLYWMYPVFGVRATGVLGALGGIASFVGTTTIIPFMPDGWAASAGGFPAMTEKVAFLMKDFVLLAVSLYLLKQDLLRLPLEHRETSPSTATSSEMRRTRSG